MRFLVNRASTGPTAKEPPCAGATRGPESPAWPGEYLWFLDLDSLDDLLAFLRASGGGLGLFLPEEGEEYPVIEIFDEDEQEE
jgi:hypothetical protein